MQVYFPDTCLYIFTYIRYMFRVNTYILGKLCRQCPADDIPYRLLIKPVTLFSCHIAIHFSVQIYGLSAGKRLRHFLVFLKRSSRPASPQYTSPDKICPIHQRTRHIDSSCYVEKVFRWHKDNMKSRHIHHSRTFSPTKTYPVLQMMDIQVFGE